MANEWVPFRLVRADDVPATNPHNLAYVFGLQDVEQNITPGEQRADGSYVFDFLLRARAAKSDDRPDFGGQFASGTPNDRFVYLSWRAITRGDYINRVKARLSSIDWSLVHAAQSSGRRITADLSGWTPGDPRKFVVWALGS